MCVRSTDCATALFGLRYTHIFRKEGFIVPKADDPYTKKGSVVDAKVLTDEVLKKAMAGAIPPQPPPKRLVAQAELPPVRRRPGYRAPSEEVRYSSATFVTPLPDNRQTRVRISTNSAGGYSMSEEKKSVWQNLPWQFYVFFWAVFIALFITGINWLSLMNSKSELEVLKAHAEIEERQLKARAGFSSRSASPEVESLQLAEMFNCNSVEEIDQGFRKLSPVKYISGFIVRDSRCAFVKIGFQVKRVEGNDYEIRLPDSELSPDGRPKFFQNCGSPQRCAADLNLAAHTDQKVLIITRNGGYVKIQP